MYATRSGEFGPLTRKRITELGKASTRYGYSVDKHCGNNSHHGETVSVRCPLVAIATWLPSHRITAEVNRFDPSASTPLRALRRAVADHLDPENTYVGNTHGEGQGEHVCIGLHPAKED